MDLYLDQQQCASFSWQKQKFDGTFNFRCNSLLGLSSYALYQFDEQDGQKNFVD